MDAECSSRVFQLGVPAECSSRVFHCALRVFHPLTLAGTGTSKHTYESESAPLWMSGPADLPVQSSYLIQPKEFSKETFEVRRAH